MVEAWTAERVVGLELARSLVREQFPDLATAELEPFGAGFDNTAYLVGGEWVFRFPRRRIAVPLIEREVRLLPAIAPHLPFAIPVPTRVGRAEERFPWPFAGYHLLPGRTASAAGLDDEQRTAAAAPLGELLAALHAFPAAEAAALGAPGDELGRLDVAARSAKARSALDDLLAGGQVDESERRRLEHVLEATPAAPPARSPVLLHGDLYALHILVDDRARPCGVIDWGDVHLGHAAVDLSVAFAFLPPRARDRFRRAYGGEIDAPTWALARFRALQHSAAVARFARETGDLELLREACRALQLVAAADSAADSRG